MADTAPLIPEVSDEDVAWVCNVMSLRDFDSSREEFLRARETLDVSACPGSGKTTLIVAKLAIMARKWSHRTRGICVLSHTNVAREEIQRRLRGTDVGQQLLSYPHFIDTIHGFVNRFLAVPWLNSHGYPRVTVDDDVTCAYRRRALKNFEYWQVENFLRLKRSGFDKIRLNDRDLHFDLGGRPFPAGPTAATHKIVERAVRASADAGYFCYDEMFVWANALLSDCPAVSRWLQRRFPLVIIDEMQDTTDLQIGILNSVFPRSDAVVALQRIGDPNQAIYDGAETDSAASESFPDAAKCLRIPKSFRFGPRIAALASPFAVDAVGARGLDGAGPRAVADAPEHCSNAVFVFPDNSTEGVLDVYGAHVLSTFSDLALMGGVVAAVGAVHQDASDVTAGHAHFPKTVPHYWSGYRAEVARREPHPSTLVQYVRIAQAVVRNGLDLSPGVEKLAAGFVRLARHAGSAELLGSQASKHRSIAEALASREKAAAAYRRLLRAFLVDWEPHDSASWAARQADILMVAAGLNKDGSAPNARDSFLQWDGHAPPVVVIAPTPPQDAGPNVYRFANGSGRCVEIRLGSIHSVKGQTHLATLLLSTHWHEHSSKQMLPWLLGSRANLSGAKVRDRKRLLQTYVAMTRPSHLVCLAMPRSALGGMDSVTLRQRGWRVADVVKGAAHWHSDPEIDQA